MPNIIVISAVNLTNGGPLTILQNCLHDLSDYLYANDDKEVIALVHKKDLCFYPNIKYIEISWSKKSWLNRIYFEYIYSYFLSKKITPYLWLSLHDITPNVVSKKRAVYCHNPSPFYYPSLDKIRYNYKEYLFSLLYRYLYKINIRKNNFVVVQQNWLKQEFAKMYKLDKNKILIAKPVENRKSYIRNKRSTDEFLFFYPAFPRTFKNFEVICEACQILENKGIKGHKVLFTLSGEENLYAKHLYSKYHHVESISFCGLLPKETVNEIYERANCLIFSSKLETWGLPISEFLITNRPMLIADLPYAHDTAATAKSVCFFNPDNALELANRMEEVMLMNYSNFKSVPTIEPDTQTVDSWNSLFDKLMTK